MLNYSTSEVFILQMQSYGLKAFTLHCNSNPTKAKSGEREKVGGSKVEMEKVIWNE